mmetsp:Transcript_84944/g.240928  ORF Transcript_84944/g.240928 Transcript_84944/m.240928 type:complete len:269 (-) Transcript_84944:118-924(-)
MDETIGTARGELRLLRPLRLKHLNGAGLLVLRRRSQWGDALVVRLLDVDALAAQELQEVLPTVAGGVVDAAVPLQVDGGGVRLVLHEQLHDARAVRGDRVAEARDSAVVLGVEVAAARVRLRLGQVRAHRRGVPELARLLERQRPLADLLQGALHVPRHAAHLPAHLHHQVVVLDVAALQLLQVREHLLKLRVLLERLDLLCELVVPLVDLLLPGLRDRLHQLVLADPGGVGAVRLVPPGLLGVGLELLLVQDPLVVCHVGADHELHL